MGLQGGVAGELNARVCFQLFPLPRPHQEEGIEWLTFSRKPICRR